MDKEGMMWKLIVYIVEREIESWGIGIMEEATAFVATIIEGKAAIGKIMKDGIYKETSKGVTYYPASAIRKIEIVAAEMSEND